MTLSIDGSRLTLTLAASAGPAKSADWAAGQLLRVIVDSRLPDGTVTLRLGTQLLEGRSDLPLRPGQSLTLQVTQTGTPLVLRIVPEAATAPAHMTGRVSEASRDTVSARGPRLGPIAESAKETDGINRALRQVLPRQGDIQPLLDGLARTARAPDSLLPPAVAAFANRLLSRLPDIQTLVVPGELKQALRDSGLFLEAHLARNSAAPERDLKAMLLQLQGMLRNVAATSVQHDEPGNIPPTLDDADTQTATALQHRTDAALARVVMNQIDSLPRDASATTPLVVELPLRWNDQPAMLRLHIEPDDTARHEKNASPGWSVWLSFEPGSLGPVHCRLQLRGEQISATFWAEHETTAVLFQENLEKLGLDFQQEGLTPHLLRCQAGKPPLPAPRRHDILDERA